MTKIWVCDSWKKHWTETMDSWRAQGHEVKTGPYWGPDLVEWADVAIFHPVDNNLKQASAKTKEKPKDTLIVAEAVDVDIYAGHPGAVKWDYVDHLVFMAKHMQDYAMRTFGQLRKFPQDRIHLIPGGLDLSRWTMRSTPERNFDVAYIGRLWIPKNVFGAIQVFNELIKYDRGNPWRLHLLGDNKYHPPGWWRFQVESYLDRDPDLKERVSFEHGVPDVNVWLEDKAYLLQTSFKEAFGYVIAQAAAKGIKPVIQMTTGANNIWPEEWIFMTHDEAVGMFLGDYSPHVYRDFVATTYPIERRVRMFSEICGL
jgi:glycosyltransferase involved in cell wall biosynthesis